MDIIEHFNEQNRLWTVSISERAILSNDYNKYIYAIRRELGERIIKDLTPIIKKELQVLVPQIILEVAEELKDKLRKEAGLNGNNSKD